MDNIRNNNNEKKKKRHIRSASYPPAQTNHKHVLKLMEQQIKDLQKLEASSTSPIETLRIGFSGLASLLKLCTANDGAAALLFHPQQQPMLLHIKGICSSSRDLVLTFIQGLSNLHALLLLVDDVDADHLVSTYLSLRKHTARTAREIASSLRHLESTLVSSYNSNKKNKEESHMERMLDCVSIINVSVLDTLLRLLALPLSKLNNKTSCFSLISNKFRMMHKSQASSSRDEDEMIKMGNEIYNLDVALHFLVFSSKDKVSTGKGLIIVVSQRIEVLEKGFKGIEDGLANIVSHLSLLTTSPPF